MPSSDPLARAIPSGAAAAWERLRPYVRETPLEHSPSLSSLTGAQVHLKLENFQITGSFKARGAVNKLLTLPPEEARRGIVTASSGNHGAAVAYGMSRLGLKGTVWVPENASPAKIEKIRGWGADVRFFGTDSGQTEVHARQEAARAGGVYVSPYNDAEVVFGQGTIGCELARQTDRVDAVIAAVGGGGLIAGTGGVVKARFPGAQVVGGSPVNSCAMAESLRQGRVVEVVSTPTLSDGSAGGMDRDSITFGACRELLDDMVLVTEEEIRLAMKTLISRHHFLVEGSAAVPLAVLLKLKERLAGKHVVLVLCGANVDASRLPDVLR